MSIIIKGMDMPKDCSYCILANEHINGLCKKKYYCRLEADFEHCPLEEDKEEKASTLISYLKDRPCAVCTFNKNGNGCTKWDCVFEGV